MRLLAALAFSAALICAQASDPAFEVASVKPNKLGPEAPNGFSHTPGRLRVTNMPLQQLVQAAYHVKTGMLFGLKAWMTSERFDIDAKVAGRSSLEAEMEMLRTLLADRFQLRFHRETRQLEMQVMVLDKSGPKFHASEDQNLKERVNVLPTEISGVAIPFGHFVTILEAQMGRPIVNETGLTGKYDLQLKYVRDDSPDPNGPSVFAALADLGLKLQTRKAPAEVFVIDAAERPAAN